MHAEEDRCLKNRREKYLKKEDWSIKAKNIKTEGIPTISFGEGQNLKTDNDNFTMLSFTANLNNYFNLHIFLSAINLVTTLDLVTVF